MCLTTRDEVIKFTEETDIFGNSKSVGNVLSELLKEMKLKHPSVRDVRSIGLFGELELVKNRKTKKPSAPYVMISDSYNKNNRDFCLFKYFKYQHRISCKQKKNLVKNLFSLVILDYCR